jgi:hypothetical protein
MITQTRLYISFLEKVGEGRHSGYLRSLSQLLLNFDCLHSVNPMQAIIGVPEALMAETLFPSMMPLES